MAISIFTVSPSITFSENNREMMFGMQYFLKNGHLHRDSSIPSSSLRMFSIKSSTITTTSFAASYLIKECGFSPESAALAVKYVHFETPDKPDVVLKFFRNLGFSSSQIPKFFGRRPSLLLSNPEKQFLPRIRLLEVNGFSSADIVKILLTAPEILHSSIEKRLLPNLNFIKGVLPSKELVIRSVKRCPYLLTCNMNSYVIPSIIFLKESGVGDSSIIMLLQCYPRTMLTPLSRLFEIVQRLNKMGMNHKLFNFGVAISVIRVMTKETWESKIDAYKKWGWSEEVTLRAFTKFPKCMTLSEKKIMENMDYYVNKMGFDTVYIADHPVMLGYSLKKRIVPRDTVLHVLQSKELIKSRCSARSLSMSNELFQKRYLTRYKEEAPELLELFWEKISENDTPVETSKHKEADLGSLIEDAEKDDERDTSR